MGMTMIFENDLRRYHEAAKIIEDDGVYGYRTCCAKFGTEIANFLLVAYLRQVCGSTANWPAPDDIQDQVKQILKDESLLDLPSGIRLPDPAIPLSTKEVAPGLYAVENAYKHDAGFFSGPGEKQ